MTRKQLQQRINALESGRHAHDSGDDSYGTSDDDDTAVHTAPVAAKETGRRAAGAGKQASDSSSSGDRRPRLCHKCGAAGHGVAQCKSKKELRSCHACHQQGHLVAVCPRVQHGGGNGGSGEEGAPRPKNE